jgi:hypothetical protein
MLEGMGRIVKGIGAVSHTVADMFRAALDTAMSCLLVLPTHVQTRAKVRGGGDLSCALLPVGRPLTRTLIHTLSLTVSPAHSLFGSTQAKSATESATDCAGR